MKMRDELLAMADELISEAFKQARNGEVSADAINAAASLAQACVMLAKERRESEFRDPEMPWCVWDGDKNAWVDTRPMKEGDK